MSLVSDAVARNPGNIYILWLVRSIQAVENARAVISADCDAGERLAKIRAELMDMLEYAVESG